MFTDRRSKRVVFLAHCILNQNAISDGTANSPGCHAALLHALADTGVGMVQLPCPELLCLGLDRGDPRGAERPVVVENTRIRQEMGKAPAADRLKALVEQTMQMVRQYHKNGFQLLCIVGMDRSPCCGVNTTSLADKEAPGKGIFMEALEQALEAAGIPLPIIGIKATDEAVAQVLSTL